MTGFENFRFYTKSIFNFFKYFGFIILRGKLHPSTDFETKWNFTRLFEQCKVKKIGDVPKKFQNRLQLEYKVKVRYFNVNEIHFIQNSDFVLEFAFEASLNKNKASSFYTIFTLELPHLF